jgi:hypothetical protein
MADTKITDLGVLCTACGCDVMAIVDVTCPATTMKITSANWDNSTVLWQLVWTNAAGLATETIDFDLAGVALSDDDPIASATFGTAVAVTDTFTAQNDHNVTAFSTVLTIGGTPADGDSIIFKLSRDTVADNLTGDCRVLGVNIRATVSAGTST